MTPKLSKRDIENGQASPAQVYWSNTTMPAAGAEKSRRLRSIDCLRGFDMLLIAGGGTFLELLENKTGWPWVDWMAMQLKHPAWNGFTFYDFIFPLFLFIAGVSLPF